MNVLIILIKEVMDNLRDRQTVFYALLFGPVLLPLILGGSLVAGFKQFDINFDETATLAVANADRAPNLLAFLQGQNIDAVEPPDEIAHAVREGIVPIVLEIPEDYAKALRAGQPAPLTLHVNEADKASTKAARRITALLNGYERTLNALRMQYRGIDPTVFDSLEVIQNDVSTDGASGQILASLLPFLLIMSMVMGGFYLAIDTTAGERERLSLEPLLSLPIPRRAIVLGKFAATLCFVGFSAVLTMLSLYVLFKLVPAGALGGSLRFDGASLWQAFWLASPLIVLVSALLIAVAALTSSTKQAQTYLGLMMVVPMAPYFILQFVTIRSATTTMLIPMVSQYQLLERVALQDPVDASQAALSVISTLLAALVLLWVADRLYQRERILL